MTRHDEQQPRSSAVSRSSPSGRIDLDATLRELRIHVDAHHLTVEPLDRRRRQPPSVALAQARVRLLSEVDAAAGAESPRRGGLSGEPSSTRPRRRHRRLLASAAAVTLLVAVGLVSGIVSSTGPPTAAATDTLTRAAAAAIDSSDEPIGPGQYRYVETRRTDLRNLGAPADQPLSFLSENLIEVWKPADPTQEWLEVRTITGKRTWIQGDAEAARAAGLNLDEFEPPTGERRAACGDFYGNAPAGPQPEACPVGSWQNPSEGFLAELPRDPAQLLERLRQDAPDNERASTQALIYVTDALRSGMVPADLRSALYLALAHIDELTVTADGVNLDGREGTALGIDDGETRHEIVIDVDTGTFIGERIVLLDGDAGGLPDGTLLSWTAVRTSVVDDLGQRP